MADTSRGQEALFCLGAEFIIKLHEELIVVDVLSRKTKWRAFGSLEAGEPACPCTGHIRGAFLEGVEICELEL